MSFLWLEIGGNRDAEKGLCGHWVRGHGWPQSSAAELGTRPRKTCLPQVWLGLLSCVFAPACSHQPVLGRQPVLLHRLGLGLLPLGWGCYQNMRNTGLFGQAQRQRGFPSVDGEALPGWVFWYAEDGGVRTGTKFHVNLWKQVYFWMPNTEGWRPSSFYLFFWAGSQFQLHPAGWWGVWEMLCHERLW